MLSQHFFVITLSASSCHGRPQAERLAVAAAQQSHASLRAGLDPEGDAAARDGGCSPQDGGDAGGTRRGGEGFGEPRREAAALQDEQAQPETQQGRLLSHRLLRGAQHPHGFDEPPAPRRGRGETRRAQEGHALAPRLLLWPPAVMRVFFFYDPVQEIPAHACRTGVGFQAKVFVLVCQKN